MDLITINYLRFGLIYYIFLFCSICIHEWAHAYAANKLGDPLPSEQNRVTLNPMVHIDFSGTILFPLIMIFWPVLGGSAPQLALIGWGKPLRLSEDNFSKNKKFNYYLISAAGPLANLILCLVFACIGGCFGRNNIELLKLFQWGILVNSGLFAFNLIPIPPLDGGYIIKYLFKMNKELFFNFSKWGFVILFIGINIPFIRYLIGAIIFTIAGLFDILMSYIALITS